MSETKAIGKRLDVVRREENLTQEQFSEALGISMSALRNYIRGDRDLPTSILVTLLSKFNVDPLWVIAGENTDHLLNRSFDSFTKIKQIWRQVDAYIVKKKYQHLENDDRWRIVSQLYAQYVVQRAQQNKDLEITEGLIENSIRNVA